MTGKIILSMNVDGPATEASIREVIDTLTALRDGPIERGSGPHGWLLDKPGGNVRATWRYESD